MFSILPLWPATAIGFVAVVLCGLYSLRMLIDLLPPESVPAIIRGWITKSA